MSDLAPLLVVVAPLVTQKGLGRWAVVARLRRLFSGVVAAQIVPQVLTVTTFLAGVVLVASGATPAADGRLGWVRPFLPLPVLELSHFLASLAGIVVLMLARGLQQRLDAAYLLAVAFLGGGAVLSLLKGVDYEEAVFLTIMLGFLLPCRRHFYRHASLLSQAFTPGWVAALALVVIGSGWLTFMSYRHVAYAHELWWRFEFFGDASRSLRAMGAVVVPLSLYGLARLLRPIAPPLTCPSDHDLERAAVIVAAVPRASAHLAMTGDKTLLFSESGSAFIMYGVEGRSWVSLGDPVGSAAEFRELVWRFLEIVDRYAGWPAFYAVDPEQLPLYVDLGLSAVKLGEEGRVPLAGFSLDGPARKGLRYMHGRAARGGCEFALVAREGVPELLGDLRIVSDTWLAEKGTREKRFSVGFFDPAYLVRTPVAVVRQGGRIVAFATVWLSGGHEELSIDLMRFLSSGPPGLMDFLFVELMGWGREQGYRWFNLGMTPLAGLETHPLAPSWSHLGAFVFRHGEHFYHFQGLRQYKEKFDPVWQPRYLMTRGGLAVPRIAANLAALIAGSLKGAIAR